MILILGIFAIAGLAGIVWLLSTDASPEAVAPLVALVGPAIGAVGAMLVSTRSVDPAGLAEIAKLQARADAADPPAPSAG